MAVAARCPACGAAFAADNSQSVHGQMKCRKCGKSLKYTVLAGRESSSSPTILFTGETPNGESSPGEVTAGEKQGGSRILLIVGAAILAPMFFICGGIGTFSALWIADGRKQQTSSQAVSAKIEQSKNKNVPAVAKQPPLPRQRTATEEEPKKERPAKRGPPAQLIPRKTPDDGPPGAPASTAMAPHIFNDYKNELVGDQKYLNKVIDIRGGKFLIVGRTWKQDAKYCIGLETIANEADNVSIICEIHPSALADFVPEKMSKEGEQWRIRGICKGRRPTNRIFPGYEVIFERCVLVPVKDD